MAKVQLILDTALAMLNEGPADRITTNQIAKRAGISIGSLYQFFPGKEAIFYELYKQWLLQTLNVIDETDARFDGSEPFEDFTDALFESLSGNRAINSLGHWQLMRAMGSTEELVALEKEHHREVFRRTIGFQKKFGRKIAEEQANVLAALQHHVTVGCLVATAQTSGPSERAAALEWGKKTMRLIYDIEKLNA
ncbi:TetR/AcrR family transcriptional regulator [Roseibium sp.]|uniref:TetR/AcrR family transcriptional regulator n=1 Tax=Roseibium sp. TaxID=1936156 RepID=UPI003A96BD91